MDATSPDPLPIQLRVPYEQFDVPSVPPIEVQRAVYEPAAQDPLLMSGSTYVQSPPHQRRAFPFPMTFPQPVQQEPPAPAAPPASSHQSAYYYNMPDPDTSGPPAADSPYSLSLSSSSLLSKSSRTPTATPRTAEGLTRSEMQKLNAIKEATGLAEFQRKLKHMREIVEHERKRADNADGNVKLVLAHLKRINAERLAAQARAIKAREELSLYRIQLERANAEIRRAQNILSALEGQRTKAEVAATHSRTEARKLELERLIIIATEKGRLKGFEEGLREGRDAFQSDTSSMTGLYTPGDGTSIEDSVAGQLTALSDLLEPGPQDERDLDSPPVLPPVAQALQTPFAPPPPPDHPAPPEADVSISSRVLAQAPVSPEPTTSMLDPEPIAVSVSATSRQAHTIPPDTFIPNMDADGIMRIPTPHQFTPQALPPTDLPPTVPAEPPYHERHRRRRASSTESSSTEMSQMSLLRIPADAAPQRSTLTPISEHTYMGSTSTSPIPGTPAALTRQSSNVTSRSPAPGTPALQQLAPPRTYAPPRSSSDSDTSSLRRPNQQQDPNSAVSSKSSVYDIHIVPPSAPETGPNTPVGPVVPGMLSPEFANRPLPPVNAPPPAAAAADATSAPVELSTWELPPGFQPIAMSPGTVKLQLDPVAATSGSPNTEPVIPDERTRFESRVHQDPTSSESGIRSDSDVDTLTTQPQDLDRAARRKSTGKRVAPSTLGMATPYTAAGVALPPSTIATPHTGADITLSSSTIASPRTAAGVVLPPSTVVPGQMSADSVAKAADGLLPSSTAGTRRSSVSRASSSATRAAAVPLPMSTPGSARSSRAPSRSSRAGSRLK
ncbi:hypothetical protein FISHEDRAFT_77210 [Fistulina hepatica ATCC 64428]|uniref:Uncharacterized protein n=1 Tax=Fistulina hepatica ATCC 64428 TaxID=1128425 RepID=A0A0D7A4J4_9AGAR|nr:hypothetical protein FISHEDRAFT_77210 [Fistulina hepatica ATCC 64428]